MITNRTINFPAVAVFALLLLISLTVAYLMANEGVLLGVMVLLASIGVLLVAAVLKDYRIGF